MEIIDKSAEGRAKAANRLALAGFAPFAVCLVLLLAFAPGEAGWQHSLAAMRGYGIAILSFLGGVRWGAALDRDGAPRTFLHSVTPALMAWSTLFMTPVTALAVLAMAFAGQGAWDALSAQNGALPGWYGTLRMKLTFLVVAALVIAMGRVGQI